MTNEERIKTLETLEQQYDSGIKMVGEIKKDYRLIQKEAIIDCLRIMEENGFFSEDYLKLLNIRTTYIGGPSPHESLLEFRENCEMVITHLNNLYPDQEV